MFLFHCLFSNELGHCSGSRILRIFLVQRRLERKLWFVIVFGVFRGLFCLVLPFQKSVRESEKHTFNFLNKSSRSMSLCSSMYVHLPGCVHK